MQKVHRDPGEDEETADTEAATSGRPGWWYRVKATAARLVVRKLDGVIAALQRQRLRFAPAGAAAADGDAVQHDEHTVPARRTARTFLLGVLLLLTGIFSGAWFSFALFSQKIERQDDLIANQAEEVFEYDRDARRAERALEKSRDEAKAIEQELAETRLELQKIKARLAEIEGRAALYGTKPLVPERDASAAMAAATPAARRYRVPNRTCNLGTASLTQDLTRCLGDEARR